jgi:hypothetical protein
MIRARRLDSQSRTRIDISFPFGVFGPSTGSGQAPSAVKTFSLYFLHLRLYMFSFPLSA